MRQSKNLRSDDEMSLVDLWEILCAGWRWILSSVVVALLIAGIYLAVTPSKFEATLVVKVGRVGVVGLMQQKTGLVGVSGLVQQIESPDDVLERMQGADFQNDVLKSLGWKGDERERLFKESYLLTVPAPKQVKIRLHGLSPDDAKRAAEACLAVLVDIHRGLAEEIVGNRDREFASLVADIADAEAFLHRIEPLGKDVLLNDRKQGALWLQAVIDEKSRLRTLRVKESLMRASMKPEFTKPTMAAEPTVVSDEPVYPKTPRVWLFAIVGGLFLGVLLVSLRSIALINKENCPPRT